MKRYSVTVNGTVYDVTVEETDEERNPAFSAGSAVSVKPPAAAPIREGDVKIEAPMPGMVVDIKLNAGAAVQKGAVIAVLEAMKMENDIVAPTSGIIVGINVKKGDSVNTGTIIATIDSKSAV